MNTKQASYSSSLVASIGILLAASNFNGAQADRGIPALRANLHLPGAISEEPCTCGNGKAKIWGPGGPHTALIPVAELFNAQVNTKGQEPKVEVEICYGPESTWRSDALQCASGFMTAAEQQTAGFIRTYEDILDTSGGYGSVGTPLALHKTVLLVPAGNPKGITSLDDLLERDDVGMVIVDGNYHGTFTSGTALWEDVIGRTAQLEDTVNLRQKICYVASGAGDARNQLLDTENTGCDAWIYWEDWAVANPTIIEAINLPPSLEIFRGLSVIPTINHGGSVVEDFISFALSSEEANNAMENAAWYADYN